jgi:hypothetical protein
LRTRPHGRFRATASLAALLVVLAAALPAFGSYDLDTRGAGSATSLRGRVYALAVFISTPDSPWDPAAKERMLLKQDIAEAWLVEEARQHDVDLAFERGVLGEKSDVVMDTIVQGAGSGDEPVDLVSRVLAKAGYSDPPALHGWAARYKQCDHVMVLLYANVSGIGYSMSFAEGMSRELYFLEGMMLYRDYPDGNELAPASIAHETLHLFGAWDLYETFEQTADRARKAAQLFGDDIMHRTSYDIEELEVGELSAWRVGWNDEPETYFEWFRTPGGQYGPVPP